LAARVKLGGAPTPLGMLDALRHQIRQLLGGIEVFLFAREPVRIHQQRKGTKLIAVLHADLIQRAPSAAGRCLAAALDGGSGGEMPGRLLHLEEEIRRLEAGLEVFFFAEHLVGANELGRGVGQRTAVQIHLGGVSLDLDAVIAKRVNAEIPSGRNARIEPRTDVLLILI